MSRSFSETISLLRREKGLSQRAAAADLHISQALLSHYENGAREPGLDFVCRVCRYYGVSADYLLGLSEHPTSCDAAIEVLRSLNSELDKLALHTKESLKELKK